MMVMVSDVGADCKPSCTCSTTVTVQLALPTLFTPVVNESLPEIASIVGATANNPATAEVQSTANTRFASCAAPPGPADMREAQAVLNSPALRGAATTAAPAVNEGGSLTVAATSVAMAEQRQTASIIWF
jgi:hypothetical protein